MKTLITVNEIRMYLESGKTEIYLDKNTIITPAAIDAAKDNKITLKNVTEIEEKKASESGITEIKQIVKELKEHKVVQDLEVDTELITRIVREVLAEALAPKPAEAFTKEADLSGLLLVRGNTVKCERFDSGNPNSTVGLKDIVNTRESPNMGAGFMTIEKSCFNWELCYEEFDYIIEGNLDITINGKTYKGKAGDVFFIPKNSKITWSTDGYAKFFYTTYPANWAELALNKL